MEKINNVKVITASEIKISILIDEISGGCPKTSVKPINSPVIANDNFD